MATDQPGESNLANITQIEIHSDTWGGLQPWIDGVALSRPVS